MFYLGTLVLFIHLFYLLLNLDNFDPPLRHQNFYLTSRDNCFLPLVIKTVSRCRSLRVVGITDIAHLSSLQPLKFVFIGPGAIGVAT